MRNKPDASAVFERVRRSRTKARGSITVLVLVVLIAFAIVLGAVAALIARQAHEITRQKEIERAFNVAEAGVHYTIWCLNDGTCSSLQALADDAGGELSALNAQGTLSDSAATPEIVGTFRISVDSVRDGGTTATVRSTGSVPSGLACQIIDADVESVGGVYSISRWDHTFTTTCESTIFIANQEMGGNLGGLSRADSICQDRADIAGLPDSTQYRALLSDSTTDARDHVSIAGPVYTTAGTRVADGPAELWSGSLQAAILDEGGAQPHAFVWTGSNVDGTKVASSTHCQDWTTDSGGGVTGQMGISWQTGFAWIAEGPITCSPSQPKRLYCVGPR